VVDRGCSFFDERDEELYAFVRLVSDIADLLLLVTGERIFGALCMSNGSDDKKNGRKSLSGGTPAS
jgi:hypothetical protein